MVLKTLCRVLTETRYRITAEVSEGIFDSVVVDYFADIEEARKGLSTQERWGKGKVVGVTYNKSEGMIEIHIEL